MIWDHKRMKKSMPERVIRAFMFQLLQVSAGAGHVYTCT